MKLQVFDGVAVAFALGVLLLCIFQIQSQGKGSGRVLISDGRGDSLYTLEESGDILLEGPVGRTLVRREKGAVRVVSSDCLNDLCVRMGTIQRAGEWIACLPNRVFLRVVGAEEGEVDVGAF